MTSTDARGRAPHRRPIPNEVRLTINGREVVARKGDLVIAAAQRVGDYIPRFCYHERMSSVGMCRMCLVDVDTGRGPGLQPSCMITVAPGMVVDTQSAVGAARSRRRHRTAAGQHPLDCPVCDKGGECPLQDQAFSHGPGESRYVEEKRHFEKPIPISDLVLLDRERCILCDRCTRFADEVAGDALIHFTSRGNDTQITTFPDEPFVSYFSGNTVQICPVGALTAKPYRFKARPWDLDQTESTCTTCAVGCRTVVQSSHDELLRYQGVDSDPVNWGWLCDRGRFNFEAVNSDDSTECATGSRRRRAATDDVERGARSCRRTDHRGQGCRRCRHRSPCSAAPVARNEDAYAWARLAHDVIGTPHVYPQMGDGAQINLLGFDRATIDEAANADDDHPDRARISKKSCRCCTCGCATPSQKRRSQDHRVRPEAQWPLGPRLADDRVPSRRHHRGRRCVQLAIPTSSANSPRATSSSSPVGPTLPSIRCEVGNGVIAALQLAPGGQGAAGVPAWQRRRRDRDGS